MTSIRAMRPDDWPLVAAIYDDAIASSEATFETSVPSYEAWDAAHRRDLRYVAVSDGDVRGWIAASPVSPRPVYAGVVEHGIYVGQAWTANGLGTMLLQHFVTASERAGVWTIQAMLFPENEASMALHERCGFRRVGVRERLGRLRGRWRDVVLVERRSTLVG